MIISYIYTYIYTKAKKQKLVEKQLHGYFEWQVGKTANMEREEKTWREKLILFY